MTELLSEGTRGSTSGQTLREDKKDRMSSVRAGLAGRRGEAPAAGTSARAAAGTSARAGEARPD